MNIVAISAVTISLLAGAAQASTAQDQPAPAADPSASQNAAVKSSDTMDQGGLAAGKNSFTMKQAQERIRKAGFTEVSVLTKDSTGLWQGQANRGGRRVSVSLDYKGDVQSQ